MKWCDFNVPDGSHLVYRDLCAHAMTAHEYNAEHYLGGVVFTTRATVRPKGSVARHMSQRLVEPL